MCPCCKQYKETTSHLLQCTSNPVYKSSLESLRTDICQTEAHPARHLIYAGLAHYSSQAEIPFAPNLDAYPMHLRPAIQAALESQEEIGWPQAMKGFLSSRWRDLASLAMFHIGSSDDEKGLSSMQRVLHAIHAHNIRLWTSRNQVLHSTDDEDLVTIRSGETAEITKMYGQPDLMRLADRHLCSRSLPKLLKSAPSTRRRWLRRVKLSRELYSRDGSRQVLITSFLKQPD